MLVHFKEKHPEYVVQKDASPEEIVEYHMKFYRWYERKDCHKLINDYMQNSRKKYLDQMREYNENPFEGLWNELQNIAENHTAIMPILDELDVVLMGIIATGVKNISNLMGMKDWENVFIEAYHIFLLLLRHSHSGDACVNI